MVDKVLLRFCRCVLNVKATTSNIMIFGECKILPLSMYRNVSVLCYIIHLHCMPNYSIVKYESGEGPPRFVKNRNLLSHPDDLRMEAYVIRVT